MLWGCFREVSWPLCRPLHRGHCPPLPARLSGLSALAVSGWLDAWTDPLRLVSTEQWDAPRWLAARAPPVISLVGSRRDICRLIHTRQWPALVRQSGSYDDALR